MTTKQLVATDYSHLISDIASLLERARHTAARSVNSILTATYWEIGRRIVEFEQGGKERAEYGEALLRRLAGDLTTRHGRGFSRQGLQKMRAFYLGWEICPTVSGKFEAHAKGPTLSGESGKKIGQTLSAESMQLPISRRDTIQPDLLPMNVFPLSWSQYVLQYLTNLPDEDTLRREILKAQRALLARWKEAKSDE